MTLSRLALHRPVALPLSDSNCVDCFIDYITHKSEISGILTLYPLEYNLYCYNLFIDFNDLLHISIIIITIIICFCPSKCTVRYSP